MSLLNHFWTSITLWKWKNKKKPYLYLDNHCCLTILFHLALYAGNQMEYAKVDFIEGFYHFDRNKMFSFTIDICIVLLCCQCSQNLHSKISVKLLVKEHFVFCYHNATYINQISLSNNLELYIMSRNVIAKSFLNINYSLKVEE
jgi:hypothetical protein